MAPTEVWYRVQTLLAAHNSAGDRRCHDHNLNGTVHRGEKVEQLVADHYKTIQIPPDVRQGHARDAG